MSHRAIISTIATMGIDPLPGEVWAHPSRAFFFDEHHVELDTLTDYAVSSAGRAVSLPRTIRQRGRGGVVHERPFRGGLLDPHLEWVSIGDSALYLAPAVLIAFDRPPTSGKEKARRRNGVVFDCRLVNLAWESDLTDEAMPEFARLAAAVGATEARRILGHSTTIVGRWLAWAVSVGVERSNRHATGAARFWAEAAVVAEERVRANARRRSDLVAGLAAR